MLLTAASIAIALCCVPLFIGIVNKTANPMVIGKETWLLAKGFATANK